MMSPSLGQTHAEKELPLQVIHVFQHLHDFNYILLWSHLIWVLTNVQFTNTSVWFYILINVLTMYEANIWKLASTRLSHALCNIIHRGVNEKLDWQHSERTYVLWYAMWLYYDGAVWTMHWKLTWSFNAPRWWHKRCVKTDWSGGCCVYYCTQSSACRWLIMYSMSHITGVHYFACCLNLSLSSLVRVLKCTEWFNLVLQTYRFTKESDNWSL
jgi:hypothetical protein